VQAKAASYLLEFERGLSTLRGMASSTDSGTLPAWRLVSFSEAEVEPVPPGKVHHWYCKPGMVRETNLLLVRAHLLPGEAHRFHHHPHMEELLYVLSGTAEQWVERELRIMKPGDSLYLPAGIVHGTYNVGQGVLEFLAVLSPAKNPGPITVDDGDVEPWNSLRP
jgi:quercetin dioxygenase-like cupin family protein